ncbi:MAG: hypothetical protein U1F43_05435 [Myxococcota bacterium]
MRPIDFDACLEAIYAVQQPRVEWLRRVVAAVEPALDLGLGVCGYFVDASSESGFEAFDFCGTDVMRLAFERWQAQVPVATKRNNHLGVAFGIGSALYPALTRGEVDQGLRAVAMPDIMGINGIDASGRGAALAVASPQRIAAFTADEQVQLKRFAHHLARGARLVLDGVIGSEPDGTQPATAEIGRALGREALRNAAVEAERAGPRRDEAEARAMWAAIRARDVVTVDRFDHGGRRYLVAVPVGGSAPASSSTSAASSVRVPTPSRR